MRDHVRSREITRDHASMRLAGSMRMDRRREAQSRTAGQREGGEWWAYHLRQHHAARSERKRSTQFVAVSTGDPLDPVWYGQLVLCFVAVYLGQKAEFCYVRWLGRVQKVAQAAGHSLDPADTRFPFTTHTGGTCALERGGSVGTQRPASLTPSLRRGDGRNDHARSAHSASGIRAPRFSRSTLCLSQ